MPLSENGVDNANGVILGDWRESFLEAFTIPPPPKLLKVASNKVGFEGMAKSIVVRFNFENPLGGDCRFPKWNVDKGPGLISTNRIHLRIHSALPVGICDGNLEQNRL